MFWIVHSRTADERLPTDEHGAIRPQFLFVDGKVCHTIAVFAASWKGKKENNILSEKVMEADRANTIHVLEAFEISNDADRFRCQIRRESQPHIVPLKHKVRVGMVQLKVLEATEGPQGLINKKKRMRRRNDNNITTKTNTNEIYRKNKTNTKQL